MKTEIICITDRSGSMHSIKTDADGGFNNFIKEQLKEPGEARVTHVWFDTQIETLYEAKPLAEVPPMDLKPRGSTALRDAIGITLTKQGERIAREKWAELVVVLVITDGAENASHEYTQQRVKEMITHCESNGWKFIFLAANIDAAATAHNFGVLRGKSVDFAATAFGTQTMYNNMSKDVKSLRAGGGFVDNQPSALTPDAKDKV